MNHGTFQSLIDQRRRQQLKWNWTVHPSMCPVVIICHCTHSSPALNWCHAIIKFICWYLFNSHSIGLWMNDQEATSAAAASAPSNHPPTILHVCRLQSEGREGVIFCLNSIEWECKVKCCDSLSFNHFILIHGCLLQVTKNDATSRKTTLRHIHQDKRPDVVSQSVLLGETRGS